MSPGTTSPPVVGELACFGVRRNDGVRHRYVFFDLEVGAHTSWMGDSVTEGTGPSWEVSANPMEVVDVRGFAGGLAEQFPLVVVVIGVHEVEVDGRLGDILAFG